MKARSIEQVAIAMGGRWLTPPVDPDESVTGASIDTRTLVPGDVFCAFRGEQVDGRTYLGRAIELGAPMCVVDEPPDEPAPPGTLLVGDLREALTALARSERDARPDLRVIGVTGTNGKTTTTRLIESVLSTEQRGRSSPKSFNNELGLPLTMLSAQEGDEFLVCEMGTSSPGEIERLTTIARPDVVVITSIGRGHLEKLGSVEGVAREKSSIIEGLAEAGVAIVTDDSPELEAALAARAPMKTQRVGEAPDSDWRIQRVRSGAEGVTFELSNLGELTLPLPGAHNARNGAIAAAVGARLGLGADSIRRGLAEASSPEMRLSVEPIEIPGGEVVLINDAYNANPDSMRAALATLATFDPPEGARRVAVLGDMLELGGESDAEHASLLESAPVQIDLVIALGQAMSRAAGSLPNASALGEATDNAAQRAAGLIRPGDVVLLKASRSMRLERVREALLSVGAVSSAVHSPSRTDAP